ncbi:MAG: DUF1638 domain-containing protein [Candidatus Bathyarchaeota archaeon]|nr:DUF1638 domain-containing protein [Candidatus Bathyarchaeota archaeon]
MVSCSVLQAELEQLVLQGDLDVDLVFVEKYFHVDFGLLEKNLRQALTKIRERCGGRMVLVYGDLCLGGDSEMKRLADEFGVVKVDARNCADALLGGKGKVLEVDPNQEVLFLYPGMTDFFLQFKDKLQQEMGKETFGQMFSGLKGIVLLDTLGQAKKNLADAEKLETGLEVLENRSIGLEPLKALLLETLTQKK